MYETHHDTWEGDAVHTTQQITDAQALREDFEGAAFTITVGNTDLPAFVSDGKLYVQAPLPLVFKAFAENLSDFISDMEIRVSDARGRPLSLDRNGRPIYRAPMAESSVVRSGGKR